MAFVSEAPRAATLNTGWFAGLAATIRQQIAFRRAYRETYDELSAMSEKELNDIGLNSLMVRDVALNAATQATQA